jgi:hypothetical protein
LSASPTFYPLYAILTTLRQNHYTVTRESLLHGAVVEVDTSA